MGIERRKELYEKVRKNRADFLANEINGDEEFFFCLLAELRMVSSDLSVFDDIYKQLKEIKGELK